VRLLRAFVWLRWRVLVNSLERTGARDTLDRLSIAVENIGPIIALLLLVPSSLGMAVLGGAAGFGLASGAWLLPFDVLRHLLLAAVAFSIVGPIALPSRDAGNPVRYLLLPVPRQLLYLANLVGTFADPWILLSAPAVLGVGVGMLIARRPPAALAALLAGATFVFILARISAHTSAVVHLLLRNRRRGEIVMLLLVLILPMFGVIPEMMRGDHRRTQGRAGHEQIAHAPTAMDQMTQRAAAFTPSELYRQTGLRAVQRSGTTATPLVELLAIGVGLQLLGFAAFSRVLDMPQTLGARRGAAFGGLWSHTIPGLTAGASAVALTQFRLALRSTRGRSILISPLMLLAVFGTLLYRRGGMPLAGLSISDGLTLATVASFIAMFAVMPIAANQFAVERAGFTRQMLSPLGVGELLAGKAVGNALICLGPAIVCVLISAAVFPGGEPALWLALPPAWIATYVAIAPIVAALSAIFPREVDLSRIGNGSNAHQAAGLLSVLALAVCGAPSLLLVLLATRWLHRPGLAPVFTLGWCLVAIAVSYLLFMPVRRLVHSRLETLAQYA
jgi:hypothetical protein